MKTFTKRTTASILFSILEMKAPQLAEVLGCGTDTIYSLAAGRLAMSENMARKLELETGISLQWLLAGDVEAPPVDARGEPYTRETYEWVQSSAKAGKPHIRGATYIFPYVMRIAAIGSAAGDKGRATLFTWRLDSFLKECAKEFGYDEQARLITEAILRDAATKCPELGRLAFEDTGFDQSMIAEVLKNKGVQTATKKAIEGKPPGHPIDVKVSFAPKPERPRRVRRPKGKP